MRRYSKLFGAGTGVLIGQILHTFLPPETAGATGQILELALPLIGTFLAPPNTQ